MSVSTDRHDIVRIGTLLLISALAFVHLMAIPAFEDEGSQLRLVWRTIEAGEWLQPLVDGKPLEAWPMVPLLKLPVQPLAAIRAVHVLVGMIAAALTYQLARQVADRTVAWISGALFAICPFVVSLQRFALSDILLCAAGTWVLVCVLRLIESPTWRSARRLALGLVLTAFCKFPVGFVYLTTLPLALALLFASRRHELLERPQLTRLLAAHAPVLVLALSVVCVAAIRWRAGHNPGFGLQDLLGIGLGNYRNIGAAIGGTRPNLMGELSALLSGPVVAIGLLGLAVSAVLGDWRQRWLIAVGVLPMLAIGCLAEFWFSRYLLFTLPPLIVAAVCGWQSLAARTGRWRLACQIGALAICVVLMLRESALLILDPEAASWSALDRYQYLEGPGSGYGYPEAAHFILSARQPPRTVYSLDGHSAYQLRNYLPAGWWRRVIPIFYAPDGRELRSDDERWANLLSSSPAWVVIPEPLLQRYLLSSFGAEKAHQLELTRIATFDKPGRNTRLAIYEVTGR